MNTPSNTSQAGRAGALPGDRTAGDYAPYEALRGAGGLSDAPRVEPENRARDRIVLIMMVLVAAAAGGMMHVQAGVSLPLCVLFAVIALGVFMALHALAGRSAEVSRLRLEIARLEHEMARMKTQNIANAGRTAASAQADPRVSWPPAAAPAVEQGRAEARKPAAPARDAATAPASAHANDTASEAHAASEANNVMPQMAQPPDARWEAGQPSRNTRNTQQASTQTGVQQQPSAPAKRSPPTQIDPAPAPAASARASQQAATGYANSAAAAAAGSGLSDLPQWPGTSESASDPMRDNWGFRPRDATEGPSSAHASGHPDDAPRMPLARTVEADLEMVQRKIKALADEVNANEALRGAHVAEPSAAIDDSIAALRTTAERMKPPRKSFSARPVYADPIGSPAQSAQRPAAQSQPAQAAAPAPMQAPAYASSPGPSQQSVHQGPGTLPSLDTLIPATAQPIAVSQPQAERAAPPAQSYGRDAQGQMPQAQAYTRAPTQEQAQPKPQARPQPSQPPRHSEPARTPPPASAEPARAPRQPEPPRQAAPTERRSMPDRRLAEIAAAIDQRRMDVFLNPIVGLGDYAVTHFEVDVRLRAEGGDYLDNPAATLALHATDLLALFDIERLDRTALVAEQLEARGKNGALLSPTAGQSMTDGNFLEAFARTFETRTSISGQLVLTFTQADISAFGPGAWQALADMHSFGFRFALEQVTHLGTDFASLAERGFAFVKLPAAAFLDGLPAGHGMVPPADICRHMAGAGLTLVVESIDEDQLLARVFGFGALFGQGRLFGGSRQITLDALGDKRTAA